MSEYFNTSELENLSREISNIKDSESNLNKVERAYPAFDIIESKEQIIANSSLIPLRESDKNQNDIKSNTIGGMNSMALDDVGGSFHIIERLYKENNWVHLAVNVISAICTSTFPLFRLQNTNGKAVSKAKQYRDLFETPNQNENGYEMIYKTFMSLAKYGNAYWQVIKKRNGDIHSLYHIPTKQLRAVPFINKKTKLMEFCYFQVNCYTQRVDRVFFQEEIIHFKLPNDESPIYGFSPVVPLFRDLTFDTQAKNWINSWFDKTFSAGMIFKMENSSKEVVRRNRTEMKEKFEGSQNAGRTMVLEGDMNVVYDGNKARDVNFSELKQISRDDIITSFGLGISTAGIRTSNGSGNAEVIASEEKATLRNTVLKYQAVFVNTINHKLFKIIMKDDQTVFSMGTNSTFISKDAIDIVQAASKFGGTTINENRDMLGIPTKEGEADYYDSALVSTNNGILPLEVLFDNFKNPAAQDGKLGLNTTTATTQPTIKNNPEAKTVTVK